MKMNTNQKHRLRLSRRPKGFKEITRYPILPPTEKSHSIRLDTLIAALPLIILSVYHYGFRPVTVTLICTVMMMGLDAAVKSVLKKQAKFDITPALEGVIVALFLPASAPLWLPIVISVFATVIKLALGRLKISVSPIAVSLILAFLLFPGIMNIIPEVGQRLHPFAFSLDSFKALSATPLEKVHEGFLPDTTTFETFFGLSGARIGEISGFLLLIVFVYLLIRRTVKLTLPVTFILSIGLFAYLNPSLEAASDFIAFDGAIYNAFGSNTFLCAVFLLSAPKMAAKNPLGTVICGVLAGIITVLLRGYIAIGLSALIAVVFIEIALPIVNRFVKTTPFGGNITPKKEENKIEKQ